MKIIEISYRIPGVCKWNLSITYLCIRGRLLCHTLASTTLSTGCSVILASSTSRLCSLGQYRVCDHCATRWCHRACESLLWCQKWHGDRTFSLNLSPVLSGSCRVVKLPNEKHLMSRSLSLIAFHTTKENGPCLRNGRVLFTWYYQLMTRVALFGVNLSRRFVVVLFT